jgi:hypothetical protein
VFIVAGLANAAGLNQSLPELGLSPGKPHHFVKILYSPLPNFHFCIVLILYCKMAV